MFGLPILFLKITNKNISGILTGKFLSFTVTNIADGSILVLAVVHALCNRMLDIGWERNLSQTSLKLWLLWQTWLWLFILLGNTHRYSSMIHTIYAFCDIYSQVLIPVHTVYNCYEKKNLFPYDPISHCKFDTEITIDVDFIQLQNKSNNCFITITLC